MDEAIAHYPADHRRSAAMPLLHLWQEHFGFISDEGARWIAAKLNLQPINILELVTFYPMFRQKPPGKTHIRVCRTLSCAMASSYRLMENLCAATRIERQHHGDGMHDRRKAARKRRSKLCYRPHQQSAICSPQSAISSSARTSPHF